MAGLPVWQASEVIIILLWVGFAFSMQGNRAPNPTSLYVGVKNKTTCFFILL